MASYITLIKFTQKGIESIKDGPGRVDLARQLFRANGAELKTFYLTLGRYDAVVISEAPNDEAVARLALATGRAGNVSTESLRAFTEDEYRKIVAALP